MQLAGRASVSQNNDKLVLLVQQYQLGEEKLLPLLKALLLFYSETTEATITLHLIPQEYPHVSQNSSLCGPTNLFYVFVRLSHRNCRWRTQTALCNSMQGRRQLVGFCAIPHHLLAWERAALNLTHTVTVIFLGRQRFQLNATFLSSHGDCVTIFRESSAVSKPLCKPASWLEILT